MSNETPSQNEIAKTELVHKRSWFKRPILLTIIIIGLLVIGNLLYIAPSTDNELGLNIERISTPEELAQGLSSRPSIKDNYGLLFDFKIPGYHGIWMKDMNFAIDIIWLDAGYKVVHIVDNAPPAGSNPDITYVPSQLASFVLEINAGQVKKRNISVGDTLEL